MFGADARAQESQKLSPGAAFLTSPSATVPAHSEPGRTATGRRSEDRRPLHNECGKRHSRYLCISVSSAHLRQRGRRQMSNLLFSVQGRANRAKFWLVALGIVVVEVILFAVILGGAALSGDPEQIAAAMGPVASVVILVFAVIATWISIAVAVKRYHDRNKSGWWVLIVFVPVIGGLWYLIECGFLRGTPGPNSYGPDPLAAI